MVKRKNPNEIFDEKKFEKYKKIAKDVIGEEALDAIYDEYVKPINESIRKTQRKQIYDAIGIDIDEIKSNPYQVSSYQGDSEYSINATGDAVVGDKVRFERAVFSGSFKKPKFERFELVTGEIIKDSYGEVKQQHTFTLLLPNGEKMLIKGRNLYGNGLWRKPWINENERKEALDEKHRRGNMARSDKRERLGINPQTINGKEFITLNNPSGVSAIPTKKLKQILDEPYTRGVTGKDFEAKYSIEEMQDEYYRRLNREEDKRLKKILKEQDEFMRMLSIPFEAKVRYFDQKKLEGMIKTPYGDFFIRLDPNNPDHVNYSKEIKENENIKALILDRDEMLAKVIIPLKLKKMMDINYARSTYHLNIYEDYSGVILGVFKGFPEKEFNGDFYPLNQDRWYPELIEEFKYRMTNTGDKITRWDSKELVIKDFRFKDETKEKIKPKKENTIKLNWSVFESLKEAYAYLEIPDFPFYNVRIYFGNFYTVYVSDGYKTFKEKDFKSLDEAVDFAEAEFLALVAKDKDYDVEIGREVGA